MGKWRCGAVRERSCYEGAARPRGSHRRRWRRRHRERGLCCRLSGRLVRALFVRYPAAWDGQRFRAFDGNPHRRHDCVVALDPCRTSVLDRHRCSGRQPLRQSGDGRIRVTGHGRNRSGPETYARWFRLCPDRPAPRTGTYRLQRPLHGPALFLGGIVSGIGHRQRQTGRRWHPAMRRSVAG